MSDCDGVKGLNDNARLWVEALRSGRYKQARGVLRNDDTFCCLGVACDLYSEQTGGGEWQHQLHQYRFVTSRGVEGNVTHLPAAVRDWLGIRGESGDFRTPDSECSDALTDHNDAGETFEQIADLIESQPTGLFA